MYDISASGVKGQMLASKTFPGGLSLSEWCDDSDPIDLPSVQIADTAKGINGDLLVWSKPELNKITLNVIPDGEDDENLQILFNANKVVRGRAAARDTINLIMTYPNGTKVTCSNGAITDGMPGQSASSAARKKTKSYQFTFETIEMVKGAPL